MRILIAEDDPYSQLILRMMLEKEPGCEVVTSANGAEAWKLLETGPAFDLCILDIMMPELNGLQLAARMRDDPRFEDQPIIFCTALNDRGSVEQATQLAVSHYITKPYKRDHIIRQVHRAVAQRGDGCRIEPVAKVAERLGLDPGQIEQLLEGVQAEVEKLSAELTAAAEKFREPTTGIRLNALKGAAANLGARRLAEELSELESAQLIVTQQPGFDWGAILKRVAAETGHIRRKLAAMRPAAA
ncbi:response regulator [Oleiharenicola lentus]|jgi:CheY-like chemotaxis protein|uniref:Response regulator n=1 Tax=Oleiharenicola lentus TaxID=2508720 RepID=A0A4Q1C8Z2_9BACT|nr:response regulator [Oleiharenicola lentus]RXK55302.1 response regulator [Oleiharenicola lentus]